MGDYENEIVEWQRTEDGKSKKFILLNCCNCFAKLHVFWLFLMPAANFASRMRNKHIRANDAIMELSNFDGIACSDARGEF